jgi:tRNA pseudouridine13 synthase
MKVKSRPEDFQVEELPTVRERQQGRYRYYRLTKQGLGTPEALELIRRRWNLSESAISHGGLKDKHAQTIQYLTIAQGPGVVIEDPKFRLEPIGFLDGPYGPEGFRGNRFTIRLRDLTRDKADKIRGELERIVREGVPNYFDDQRFGSVGASGEFIIHAWLKEDFDQALRLALAEPYAFDRPNVRREKDLLNAHWGDWPLLKAELDKGNVRSVVTYLCDHPTDFRGAFVRLRRDMRRLYVSAFQSHLFNEVLAAWIRRLAAPEQLWNVKFKTGPRPLWHDLTDEQVETVGKTQIVLPCVRNEEPTEGPEGEAVREVMERFGLEWRTLRIKKMDDVFFSKGRRAAAVRPTVGNCTVMPDDLNEGRRMARMLFELPRGAYATLIIKRLQAAVGERLAADAEDSSDEDSDAGETAVES